MRWPWWRVPRLVTCSVVDYRSTFEFGLCTIAQSQGFSLAAANEIVSVARENAVVSDWSDYSRAAQEVHRLVNIWPMMVGHGLAMDASLRPLGVGYLVPGIVGDNYWGVGGAK